MAISPQQFVCFSFFFWLRVLDLNSTQVYLKAVAERLKKIQCSATDKQF